MPDTVWRPHDRQREFLEIPDSVFEGFYGGAAGGGKSELLLMIPIVKNLVSHPRFAGLLLRRTYPELEKNLIRRSHFFYEPAGGHYNQQDRRWTFPSGAIIQFGYAEIEKDVRRYDSDEYQYIGFDELTSFTKFQYTYLTSRCRGFIRLIRSASNPGNIGHGWVRARFIEPAKDGYVLLKDPKSGERRIFIPAKLTDNPYLLKEDPDYEKRLGLLPEAEIRAKRDGDWWTFSGQVYDEFRYEKFPDEPDNALHVIQPFDIPKWWARVLAIDWGYAAQLWAGWAALSPDKRCYIYREFTCTRKKVDVWGATIAQLSQYEQLKHIVMDPSAWHQRGDEKTIAEQFQEHSGLAPSKADNDRIGGKILIHDFLRWESRPPKALPKTDFDFELSQRILRVKGPVEYENYIRAFEPEPPETNLPRLQIFNTCTELIKALPLCIYAKDDTQSGKKSEDVQEFDGDDPYDGCRYLLKSVDSYFQSSKSEHDRRASVDQILAKLVTDGDMTSFYRRMEALEAKNKLEPIRMFHRGRYSPRRYH